MQASTDKYPLACYLNRSSAIAENYRTLKMNIQFSTDGGSAKSIAITSPNEGDGKTTTAVNLAIVYAHEAKRVLLVDTVCRHPKLHLLLGCSNQAGLVEVLSGSIPVEDAIQETQIEHLSLLPTGALSHNLSEKFSPPRFASLLESCRERYDIILIDAPPMLQVSDAQWIAAVCDGIVLVVRSDKTKRQQIQRALETIGRVQGRTLGVVLNNYKYK
ncbi:CpsD/CapB family tyrosine-protein kinase [Paenibacillus hemerocallicola]|uniref:non-specific protein-tyrosine kinase n=1 Tax=Paenibacillus hemerocallicola TaxID=1172614 RepID=A0A5C4TCT9_9BACL|nr:CpsD/CapB family tyrosine-protein kinase [Paenibacillus hemerocallicola]TNJ66715.1 CpsD/CapB family tyrosine-protein kinase [Paenibacillus hemerocallicola]